MTTVNSLFEVPKMSCGACRSRVEGALTPLDGVAEAAVDLQSKVVTVTHNPDVIGIGRITKAIEGAGYQVASARKVA